MDCELVSDPQSDEGADEFDASAPYAYNRLFERLEPVYMAMGMPRSEYWDGDPTAVIAYRQADRIREDRMNQQLWLQGMYIYEALCDVSPLLHAFGKSGTTAHPFSEKPYDLHPDETRRKQQRNNEKKTMTKGLAYMSAFMSQFNKKHSGGDTDG